MKKKKEEKNTDVKNYEMECSMTLLLNKIIKQKNLTKVLQNTCKVQSRTFFFFVYTL
jgi:hypothetical protein